MNKPFVDLRQNRQYSDWTKIIIILRAIHFWDCSYFWARFQNLMNELIMSVKGLAIYSAAVYKKLAGIRSGPVDVSADRRSFNSRKTSWNVTGWRYHFLLETLCSASIKSEIRTSLVSDVSTPAVFVAVLAKCSLRAWELEGVQG